MGAVAIACSQTTTAPGRATIAPIASVAGDTPRPSRPTSALPSSLSSSPSAVERLRVEVIGRRSHDRTAFTQGLVLAGDRLYESTGLYGQSTLREVDQHTGAVLRSTNLEPRYFGEGIAVVDDRLIQLTWHEHTALVYRLNDFGQTATFTYDTEGWGLCDDGTRLVMSDGSSLLQFRDRSTFELLGTVDVASDGAPVDRLNELECVGGDIYANVLQTETIVRIDPTSGKVNGAIDASGLLTEDEAAVASVLNGIAYDTTTGTFLITGKFWPALFEVRFVPDNR